MEMTKLKVTSAIAQEWLDTVNVSNRNWSHHLVKKYASDMKAGKWRDTHQNVIAFYKDGTLADGQHRLMAIVRSGVPVDMFVASGLSQDDGGMIDQGRPRSVADALKIGGMVSMSGHTTYAVAIVKLISAAEREVATNMTISEVADTIDMLSPGIEFSCAELRSVVGVGLKNATLRSAVTVAYYHFQKPVLQRFCRVIVSGMPEGANDECLIRLRNWMLVSGPTKGGKDRIDRYRTILKYLCYYCQGHSFKHIRVAKSNAVTTGVFNDE